MQFIKYLTVQLVAYTADFSVFNILHLGQEIEPAFANPAAKLAGVLLAFTLHRYFTFKAKGPPFLQFIRYSALLPANILFSTGVLSLGLWLGFGAITAKIGSDCISLPLFFILNKIFTFGEIEPKK